MTEYLEVNGDYQSVDGTFECEACGEYVSTARFFRLDKILTWKCSQEHLSYLQEVNFL